MFLFMKYTQESPEIYRDYVLKAPASCGKAANFGCGPKKNKQNNPELFIAEYICTHVVCLGSRCYTNNLNKKCH